MRVPLTLLSIISVCSLYGCAVIQPATLRIGAEHLSSISQHVNTHGIEASGLNAATIQLQWRPTAHTYLEWQEAYIFNGVTFNHGHREIAELRGGVEIPLK
jgi:hypothetical protein